MQKRDLSYDLPIDLIAQRPLPERSASRLLVLDGATGRLEDALFSAFPERLEAGDLLVFNDTRVIRARLHGRKATGGRVEVLIERMITGRCALAQVRASKAPTPGAEITLEGGHRLIVRERRDDLFVLETIGETTLHAVLDSVGRVPLPPYIERPAEEEDIARYQTVFGIKPGAIAAPTAGLHFDEAILQHLAVKGVKHAFVTLHVGSGTFQPLRADRLEDHRMHSEYCEVDADLVEHVARTKNRGKRVIAVGTTTVRSLETAARTGTLRPYQGETDLFIRPGFPFRCVDALLTNFHLPQSTLLALVCAFAGYRETMAAYQHAVARRYRFFSYGDAMFVTSRHPP